MHKFLYAQPSNLISIFYSTKELFKINKKREDNNPPF